MRKSAKCRQGARAVGGGIVNCQPSPGAQDIRANGSPVRRAPGRGVSGCIADGAAPGSLRPAVSNWTADLLGVATPCSTVLVALNVYVCPLMYQAALPVTGCFMAVTVESRQFVVGPSSSGWPGRSFRRSAWGASAGRCWASSAWRPSKRGFHGRCFGEGRRRWVGRDRGMAEPSTAAPRSRSNAMGGDHIRKVRSTHAPRKFSA